MKQTPEKRVDPDTALAAYLAMGQGRSLAKLARQYCEASTKNGSIGNLQYWSRKFAWAERAKEHDAQVAGRTSEKAIETQASERASVFDAMQSEVRHILGKLHDNLQRVSVKTIEDLERLADVAIKLSAHSLDIQRGRQPDPDLVEALVREKLLANGTTDRATAPPTPRELNDAVDRALKEYDEETKH